MSSSDGKERDAVAALFHSAVEDAPPASFDEHDVRARYRRDRRRRMSTVAGSALAVVLAAVLVPVLVLGSHRNGGTPAGNLAAAPHVSTTTTPQRLSPFAQQLPAGPPKQGDGPHGRVGPRVDGTRSGCARVDRELATALADELPASYGLPVPVPGGCAAGGRGAALRVRGVTVSAVVLPPGVPAGSAGGGQHSRQVRHDRSGGTVVVFADGTTSPPLRAKLAAIADRLAS
jgi:hypothetical protein